MDFSSRSNTFNLDFLLPSSSKRVQLQLHHNFFAFNSNISTWPRLVIDRHKLDKRAQSRVTFTRENLGKNHNRGKFFTVVDLPDGRTGEGGRQRGRRDAGITAAEPCKYLRNPGNRVCRKFVRAGRRWIFEA